MQAFFNQVFNNTQSRIFTYVNNTLAVLTIVSILTVVLETVDSLSRYRDLFVITEWVAVAFFTIEYIGRLSISSPIWKYPTSFFGIVDLVAILPTIFGLGNFTFLKSARALRILRLLRMMRLLKLKRSNVVTDENLSVFSLNILIYLVTLLSALLITGTAMYLVEANHSSFSSIPAGMWWSLKVFMAGIPVVEPETDLGEIFFVLTRFIGLLLFGLLVGVVGNIFKQILLGKKQGSK